MALPDNDPEVIDTDTPAEEVIPVVEEQEAEGGETPAEEAQDDELVVTIDGEPAPEDESANDSAPFRQLRQAHKETTKALRQQERLIAERDAEITRLRGGAQEPSLVGEKPKLEEFADAAAIEKYETDLLAWNKRKLEAEDRQRQAQEADQRQRQQWQARTDAINKAASELKVRDFEGASMAVEQAFSVVQQGILAAAPEDAKTSALLRYAIGANPKVLKDLAAITDPIKFTRQLTRIEDKMKTQTRQAAPAPERALRGATGGGAIGTAKLESLLNEARRTGDYTKYHEAKAKKA